MGMPRARLSRDDWIDAGLTALLESGPAGVTIEGIAVRLGATKGSGYWHFESRDALLTAVVQQWRRAHTDAIREYVARQPDPEARLQRLFRLIFDRPTTTNEARVLLADDPALRAIVAEIAEERIAYVATLVAQCGIPRALARRRAETAYCAVVGHEALLAATPGALHRGSRDNRLRARSIVAALLAPITPA